MAARPRRLVLASASPGRLRLLRDAGFDPEVIVSGADETVAGGEGTAAIVLTLARRKAVTVAAASGDALVVGCDSLLDLDGVAYGKPADAAGATDQWRRMRNRAGTLLTGHCIIDTSTGDQAADVAATTVRFGSPTDAEIAAYVATGEPLAVAGAFTLDGRAAPFIDGIDGDPSNVIGLSLPLLRRLLAKLGVEVTGLWC
jgi:septum formation protein